MYKFLLLASVVGMASCQYGHQGGYQGLHQAPGGYHQAAAAYHHAPGAYHQAAGGYHEEGHDEYAEPHYSFEYSVKDPHTGDYHSQKEERKGDLTQGEYFLVEPDGSKRNVVYKVEGKSGFVAEVHREAGKGGYEQPAQEQAYYKPQQPAYYKQRESQHSYQQPAYYKQQESQHSYQQPAYYKQPSYQGAYKVHQPQHNY